MGAQGEGLEAPPEAEPQPCATGQGQSQHHQGGETGLSCSPEASEPLSSSSVGHSPLLMQVFSDQLLLKDVLSRSDRALAVVQDLFGDGPRRKTGQYTLLLFHCFQAKSINVLLLVRDKEQPLCLC